MSASPPDTLRELRALSDDELVELHDRELLTATKAQALYAGELGRRERNREARLALWIALASLAIAGASVVVAIVRI